jgi:hypothetical protein
MARNGGKHEGVGAATVTVKDKQEINRLISSSKPICRNYFTSLLSFSGMNYNDGGMAAHAISVHDSPCISSLRERI